MRSNFCFIIGNNGLQIQSIQSKKYVNHNNCGLIENNKDGIYYISNFEKKNFSEKSFFICRSNEVEIDSSDNDIYNEYYEVNQGDLIKLGKIYIKIRELCIGGKILSKNINNKNNIINRLNTSYNYNLHNTIRIKKKKLCRVCYCDDKEVDSPLISPCKCIGGLKYIHLSCLRNWIEAKAILIRNESNDECLKYEINQVNCEICQEPYPDYIYNNDKENFYEIFDFIQMKFNSYIILETIPLNNNDENGKKREIFILSFDEKDSIFIGRSHTTDMKLNDITVSRYHSKIIINRDKNKFYIRDMGSKFGTGILIQNPKIKLNANFPLYIQISKSTVLISIEKTCNFLCFFFINFCNSNDENKLFKYYGKDNSEAIEMEKIFQFKQSNEENNDDEICNYSNNYSIIEKTLKSGNSDRENFIKIPIFKNDKFNNEEYEKFNLNRKNRNENTTTNNTEATLMGTFLNPDNSQVNKTKSFIQRGLFNNNKDIKTRLMRKVGKFSVNSENIDEEDPKEENNNENQFFYRIDENNSEHSNSKNSKHSIIPIGRFKGKKGLQVSSLSFNKSILGGEIENNDNNDNKDEENNNNNKVE
jgi:hypothetical protein